ncbi:MAG: hypothetical protein ACOYYU_01315 [Chloroflexota bacterium]
MQLREIRVIRVQNHGDNMLLGVKEQVIAQYGKNSDQVQALGLKKKAEYKTPGRKAKPSV